MRIRTAVVGGGYLGRYHAEKYAKLPTSELIAIVDVNTETAKALAKTYQVEAYDHYQSLLGKVDAVSVAVPTPLHYPITQYFLAAGVHVLVEKPFTSTVAEANELIQLAHQHQCILQVGHLQRFNPAFIGLQQQLHHPRFIENERLAPFRIRGTEVNVVLDLMIHDLDLILSVVKSPIQHIEAIGTPVLSNDIDIANVRLKFMNGCIANVTASRVSQAFKRKMRVFQSDAYFSIDFQQNSLTTCRKARQEIVSHTEQFEKSDELMNEIQAFLSAILHHSTPIVTGDDGKQALALAHTISQLILNR